MIEDKIKKLFDKCKLGSVIIPIESVSGGFLHRMYKVNTEKQAFAVKHLNSNIMKRPEAMENYLRAEGLEVLLIGIIFRELLGIVRIKKSRK